MTKPIYNYVATIKRDFIYSTEYLMVGFGKRSSLEPEKVLGLRSEGESIIWDAPHHLDGLVLDSLQMRGFYSDHNRCIIWSDWEYYPYCVDSQTCKLMVRTLDKIYRKLQKEEARDPGDQLVAVCKLFRIKQVAFWRSTDYERRTGKKWTFHTVNEGRNILQDEAQEMLKQAAA
jgi:hypothetical protein